MSIYYILGLESGHLLSLSIPGLGCVSGSIVLAVASLCDNNGYLKVNDNYDDQNKKSYKNSNNVNDKDHDDQYNDNESTGAAFILLNKVTSRVLNWSSLKDPSAEPFKEPSVEPSEKLSISKECSKEHNEEPLRPHLKEHSQESSTTKSIIHTDNKLSNYDLIEDIVENCLNDIYGICVEAEREEERDQGYTSCIVRKHTGMHMYVCMYVYMYVHILLLTC
jgi:hypothetical protein